MWKNIFYSIIVLIVLLSLYFAAFTKEGMQQDIIDIPPMPKTPQLDYSEDINSYINEVQNEKKNTREGFYLTYRPHMFTGMEDRSYMRFWPTQHSVYF